MVHELGQTYGVAAAKMLFGNRKIREDGLKIIINLYKEEEIMFRKTIFALLAAVLLLSGCAYMVPEYNQNESATSAQPLDQNEEVRELNTPEQSTQDFFMPIPWVFENNADLFSKMALAKFGEPGIAVDPFFAYSTFYALQQYDMFFQPGNLRQGFTESHIALMDAVWVDRRFDDSKTEDFVLFSWLLHVPIEYAATKMFDRGATTEQIIEHNGITYGVTEWECLDTGEFIRYRIGWAQHGQTFSARIPTGFTLEEALAFSYARPIDAWELCGDAISVSIQGMNNVRIFENPDGIAAFGSTGNEIIASGNGLYRSGAVGFSAGGGMERVGYRWLIDEATHRYQYVLQPGAYEFHVTGRNGQPQLLVQHFAYGDRVASTDYSGKLAAQNANEFLLAVTRDANDNNLIIPALPLITITWNAVGGEVWPVWQQFVPGTQFSNVPLPTKLGYDFVGWWTAETGGTELLVSSIVPDSNTSFYARWTPRIFFNGDECPECEALAFVGNDCKHCGFRIVTG